ncbi:MAG: B12-binding domain-containing radical SAM protein, partial [Deltaproteobacteria bacterium]|nr:B12-binding domain-containing radical SAM protein [Deltaproteobacteria bacterium]
MRIAVIAPPYPLEEMPSPPLGVTYVAAAFEAAGAEVKIFDYIVSAYTKENLEKQLKSFKPDAVGATSVTMNFYDARQILFDVKNYNPEIITMMGGPHVSFTAEETLKQYPEIDLIVIGEGEDTIAELTPVIRQKDKWHNIRGIAYRNENEIVMTGKRDFITDIDRIPLPARRLLPISRYRALGFPVSLITGRGCPYSCIFCLGRKMVGSKVRKRNPHLVLDEIEQIIHYGFDRINIADDLFTTDKERVKEICTGIKERSLKFPWSAFARVDTVSQEVFDLMAEAGCDSVSFGVETGNPEMLKRIKKGIKLEQVYAAVKMCQQAGMIAHASFIIGLPGETRDTLQETEKFAKSTRALYGYHFLAPFPGTTVREKIQDYDLEILTDNWNRYDANDAIVKTSSLLPQEMREFGASYDEEMKDDWNKTLRRYQEEKGSLEDKMQVEGHWRMKLTYQILKNDIIEKCGFIEPALFRGSKDSALQELCRRIKENTNADSKVVEDTIRDFAGRNYLRAD